jgi:hypothetical protein
MEGIYIYMDDGEIKTILGFIAIYLPSLSHMFPCHRNNLTFLVGCIGLEPLFGDYMPKIYGSIYQKYRQIVSYSSIDTDAINIRSIFKNSFMWMFKIIVYISHILYIQRLPLERIREQYSPSLFKYTA